MQLPCLRLRYHGGFHSWRPLQQVAHVHGGIDDVLLGAADPLLRWREDQLQHGLVRALILLQVHGARSEQRFIPACSLSLPQMLLTEQGMNPPCSG